MFPPRPRKPKKKEIPKPAVKLDTLRNCLGTLSQDSGVGSSQEFITLNFEDIVVPNHLKNPSNGISPSSGVSPSNCISPSNTTRGTKRRLDSEGSDFSDYNPKRKSTNSEEESDSKSAPDLVQNIPNSSAGIPGESKGNNIAPNPQSSQDFPGKINSAEGNKSEVESKSRKRKSDSEFELHKSKYIREEIDSRFTVWKVNEVQQTVGTSKEDQLQETKAPKNDSGISVQDLKAEPKSGYQQLEISQVQTKRPPSHGSSCTCTLCSELCIVCAVNKRDSVFIHTRSAHMVCCYKCAVKTWRTTKRCPTCRTAVKNVVKVYL